MLQDNDQAYSAVVPDDDPLVKEYLAHSAAFSFAAPEQAPKTDPDEVSRLLKFADVYKGPIWYNGFDKRYYRKMPTQALFTHWPESPTQVVDDMLKNERRSGSF